MMNASKLAHIDQRFHVNARRRQYACPVCGQGELVGHGCRPATHQMTLDRYLAPILVPQARLWVGRQAWDFRNLSRFNLFVCPRCYFMLDGPVTLKDGEIAPEKRAVTFARRTMPGLAPEEGGATPGAIFWDRVQRQAAKLDGLDWLAIATTGDHLDPRFAEALRGKEHVFREILRTLLHAGSPEATRDLVKRVDAITRRGAADLITGEAFRSRPLLFALYETRLALLAVLVGRENERPFQVRPGGELLGDVARFLLSFQQGRAINHSVAGSILTVAVRMARFAPDKVDLWWCKQIGLLAGEFLVRAGFYDYRSAEVHPHAPEENNEAVRYLTLLLRRELGMGDAVLSKEPEMLRLELNHGLNRCASIAKGEGTPNERRAFRLGLQVAERVGKNFPPGFVDIHEIPVI
jgi:hypothetical protein